MVNLGKKLKRKISTLEKSTIEDEIDEPVFKKPLPINWHDSDKTEENTSDVSNESVKQQDEDDNDDDSINSLQNNNIREQEILNILNNGNLKSVIGLHCIGTSRANKILEYRIQGKTFQELTDLRNVFGDKLYKSFVHLPA